MPDVNLTAALRRIFASTVLVFSISGFPAHAASVTVDGDLTDLISVFAGIPMNSTAYPNLFWGDDPLGSSDSPVTESNNGFDIKNVYAYYNGNNDTFYFGMQFWGTVGNSLPAGSASLNEGIANAGIGSNNKAAFDANESYGVQIYLGTSITDPQLLLYEIKGVNGGSATDSTVSGLTNPYGLSIASAVSIVNNGVEFGVTGLLGNSAFSPPFPNTVTLRFIAGSGDTNSTSTALEDTRLVTMQAVPVPAAVWLFTSGLLGMFVVVRKRRNKT